ncbi:hypothetical protein QZN01_33745 [Burkholderia cenocepacia]|uniref:hypothetical protein n=1 Tax=Burkholderia cenocepacia TaxID=95486 RepID=UPI0005BAF75B|nr:hypothetical protein [Burkholderia cenocepacia]MDN7457802.1 hypothetical protein [Burkholderia cenocepacia]MDN7827659.1 hypothetical protein [Burkholderia cenocepacia]HDR9874888.1 hypothetical protein [Burkholderia cenocepacia]HEM9002132.1 hypothetical protein [Burkholderia cenocepacia]
MREIAYLILTTPPPLMVSIVFLAAYLGIGIPAHMIRGALARDIFGTMAGVFASLFYLTLVLGFQTDIQSLFE